MNQTTDLFIRGLKSKQLDQYTMGELQIKLQECYNLFERFGRTKKNTEERMILNTVWNKMVERYNQLLRSKYSETTHDVYVIDYLINRVTLKEE